MLSIETLDKLPLWGFFLLTAAVILLAMEGGYRLGVNRRMHRTHEKEAPVGAMVGATLGLLAFMLGFTFSMAASRFESRRTVLLNEANAVGTAYLRTSFLPESQRMVVRDMLRDYVDVRLEAARTMNIAQAVADSEDLHARLWAHAEAAGQQAPNSIMVGLFVEALNEVIDLHSTRLQISVRSRIPLVIWGILYLIAALGMAGMGFQAGLSDTCRSAATIVLVLAFCSVMLLIADLDRPREGMLRVSQQILVDLRASMKHDLPAIEP